MDILGIGGWELAAILLIMLIVAGPKRMIAWSYTLGRWVGQARRMWSEAAQVIQKEFDDAGIDVKVPEQPPTRASLKADVNKMLTPITQPLQETIDTVKGDFDNAKRAASIPGFTAKAGNAAIKATAIKPAPDASPPPNGSAPAANAPNFGTWSGNGAKHVSPAPKPLSSDFGSWSAAKPKPSPDLADSDSQTQ